MSSWRTKFGAIWVHGGQFAPIFWVRQPPTKKPGSAPDMLSKNGPFLDLLCFAWKQFLQYSTFPTLGAHISKPEGVVQSVHSWTWNKLHILEMVFWQCIMLRLETVFAISYLSKPFVWYSAYLWAKLCIGPVSIAICSRLAPSEGLVDWTRVGSGFFLDVLHVGMESDCVQFQAWKWRIVARRAV